MTEVTLRPTPKPPLDEATVRGWCPLCHAALLSVCRYYEGRGYVVSWECENAQHDPPTCQYRRIL